MSCEKSWSSNSGSQSSRKNRNRQQMDRQRQVRAVRVGTSCKRSDVFV